MNSADALRDEILSLLVHRVAMFPALEPELQAPLYESCYKLSVQDVAERLSQEDWPTPVVVFCEACDEAFSTAFKLCEFDTVTASLGVPTSPWALQKT